MAHWVDRKYIAPRKRVLEREVVMISLCVASGVDARAALYCLSLGRLDQLVLPVGRWSGDLNPAFSLAGCVLIKDLDHQQIAQIDLAACAQYPHWGEIKQRIRYSLAHGTDPRWHNGRRVVIGVTEWQAVGRLDLADKGRIMKVLLPDSSLERKGGLYAVTGRLSCLLLRRCADCGYIALVRDEDAVCPGCAGVAS